MLIVSLRALFVNSCQMNKFFGGIPDRVDLNHLCKYTPPIETCKHPVHRQPSTELAPVGILQTSLVATKASVVAPSTELTPAGQAHP